MAGATRCHGDEPGAELGDALPTADTGRVAARLENELRQLDADGGPLAVSAANALRDALATIRTLRDDAESVRQRYVGLINAVPDAVTLLDLDGNILEANDAACALYGRPHQLLTQLNIADLNPDLASGRMDEVNRTYRVGDVFAVEATNLRSDGARFPVEVHSAVFMDRNERRVVAVARDITQRRAAEAAVRAADRRDSELREEALRRQALTDPLTGLVNRDAALEQLNRALVRAEANPGDGSRSASPGPAILYLDLDRFRALNDLLGHQAGDHLLAAAAQRLREKLGDDALVARFGGDEFLLLLNEPANAAQAERLAERACNALSAPFALGTEEFGITASVGIACHPQHGTSAQQLLQSATAAAGEAKRRGRNTWEAFNPALAQQLSERLRVEAQLRRALENNEFRLVYQPQVLLENGCVRSVEALIRWRNPLLGEIRPDRFISHAENTGDIVRIGAWVIREACRQMRAWRDAGLGLERVAVNVSFRQFLSEDLAAIVIAALQEFDLPGSALELEITERILVEDAADTMETFAALKSLGVVMTIDDFGEGYSALNYLRRLPIDAVKISHSFMQGVPENASDVAICQAIVGIAHGLGLTVVAEGVEREEQRRFLTGLGIVLGQGFLFSEARPPEELDALLRQRGE